MALRSIRLAIRWVSLIRCPEYEVHPLTSIMLRPITYGPLPPCLSMASLLGAEIYAQPYFWVCNCGTSVKILIIIIIIISSCSPYIFPLHVGHIATKPFHLSVSVIQDDSQSRETVKYGGTQNQEWLCWWGSAAVHPTDQPSVSSVPSHVLPSFCMVFLLPVISTLNLVFLWGILLLISRLWHSSGS
jgi:hypothetical protein